MKQATKSDIKPGQHIIINYKSGGFESNLINQDPKIYRLETIKSIDERGHLWLESGNGMTLKGTFIPTKEMIKDYEKFMELMEEATDHIKEPKRPYGADQQVEYSRKLEKWSIKRFIELKKI